MAKTNPCLPLVSPTYLPSHNSPALKTQSIIPLSCHFSKNVFVLLLRCYLSPSFNHLFELLISDYSYVYLHNAYVKLVCFSLINLSFVNLIYVVQARKPRCAEGKDVFSPLSSSGQDVEREHSKSGIAGRKSGFSSRS